MALAPIVQYPIGPAFDPKFQFVRFLEEGGDGAGGDAGAGAGEGAEGAAGGSQESGGAGEHIDGQEALGDAGKKALDAMKAERNAARAAKAALEAELKALKDAAALKDKPADEQERERIRQEASAEATAKANQKLVNAELKAAATGKLANPELVQKLIDTSAISVDANGDVDAEAVVDAITDLLTKYPSLAAQGGTRQFDSGRGKQAPAGQLTQADLKNMSPEAIVKAEAEGRLDRLKRGQ
jgi:hypothetical protein